MKKLLGGAGFTEKDLVARCRERRIARIEEINAAAETLVGDFTT